MVALQGTLQGICEEKVRRRKPTTGYMVMFVSEMVRNMNSCRRSNIGRTLIFVLGGGGSGDVLGEVSCRWAPDCVGDG